MRSTCRCSNIMGTGAFQPGPVAEMPETVRRRRLRGRQCRARHELCHQGVFPGLPLSLRQRGRGGRGGAARARRLAARALHQSAHRRHRHGADGLLPGAARSRSDHASVPHQRRIRFAAWWRGRARARWATTTIRWKKRDIFTLAARQSDRPKSTGGTARLFQVSDRDIYARLGLLKEEYGNIAA